MTNSNRQALSRRGWLKLSAAGSLGLALSPGYRAIAHAAGSANPVDRPRHKQCIFVFLNGGASQVNTFDPKPGGAIPAIDTAVPGIQVCEIFPHMAKQMKELVILRGMSFKQAGHDGGIAVHTGWLSRTAGGVVRPTLGAITTKEFAKPGFELPNHIHLGGGYNTPGFFGSSLGAFTPARGANADPIPDRVPKIPAEEFDERIDLIARIDRAFQSRYQSDAATGHAAAYLQAQQLVHTKLVEAFNVDKEPEAVRKAYGLDDPIVNKGKGKSAEDFRIPRQCLMARRLIEAGVPFVEVGYSGLAWDSHQGAVNVKGNHPTLAAQMDKPVAALIADLKDRGLLDNVLIVIVGEFGRTGLDGANHYPKAFSAVLAGAGLKTGQVIGATSPTGMEVTEHPIDEGMFMATILKALGIDHHKEYALSNRPISVLDDKAEPIAELFA